MGNRSLVPLAVFVLLLVFNVGAVLRRKELMYDEQGNVIGRSADAKLIDAEGNPFTEVVYERPDDPYEALDEDHQVGDLLELDDDQFESMYETGMVDGERIVETPPMIEGKTAQQNGGGGGDDYDDDKKEALIIVFSDGTTSTLPFNGDPSGYEDLLVGVKELYWLKDGIVKEYTEEDREAGVEAWVYMGHPSQPFTWPQSEFLEKFDESTLKPNEYNLVMFYSPSCGHCRHLAVPFTQLATFVKGKLSPALSNQYHLSQVDAQANLDLARRWGVKEYPTIYLIHNNRKHKFSGKRNVETLSQFLRRDYGTAKEISDIPKPEVPITDKDVVVLTDANYDTIVKPGETLLIEFYAPWCGHCKKLEPTWNELAMKLKGKYKVCKVDATVENQLASNFGISSFPQVFKVRGDQYTKYSGSRTVDGFVKFVEKDARLESSVVAPKTDVLELDPTSLQAHLESASVPLLLTVHSPGCGHCKALAPTFDATATHIKNNFESKWHLARINGQMYSDVMTRFGVEGFPTILYFPKNGKVYSYTNTRTSKGLIDFLQTDWRSAPSKPVPPIATRIPSAVETLTDSTFPSKTKTGTFFIAFTAKWCGFCKRMLPEYEKFAAAVAALNDDSLHVVNVDSPGNEVTSGRFGVESYPHFFVYAEGRVYEFPDAGDSRNAASFLKFLQGGYKEVTSSLLPKIEQDVVGDPNDVLLLTPENFRSNFDEGVWFINFSVDSCEHCREMADRYVKLASYVKQSPKLKHVRVAKFAGRAPKLLNALGVDGYPTLVRVENGMRTECTQRHSLKVLVHFLKAGWEKAEQHKIEWPVSRRNRDEL